MGGEEEGGREGQPARFAPPLDRHLVAVMGSTGGPSSVTTVEPKGTFPTLVKTRVVIEHFSKNLISGPCYILTVAEKSQRAFVFMSCVISLDHSLEFKTEAFKLFINLNIIRRV